MKPSHHMSEPDHAAQSSAPSARFEVVLASSSNTSEELLSIVRSDPTTDCAGELAKSILQRALAYPREVDTLVTVIKKLDGALKAQSIAVSEQDTFDDELNWRPSRPRSRPPTPY